MMSPQLKRMNCNGIASFYEAAEHLSFGKSLERARFAFLDRAKSARKALICGGGDGRFLAELLKINRCVHVDFVDLSSEMAALAKARVAKVNPANLERVTFHIGDITHFESRTGHYDLMVTNFFLDCFTDCELASVVARLSSCAAPNALWMVSDFREAERRSLRMFTQAIIRGLYGAFRITTGLRVMKLPDYISAVAATGFSMCEERSLLGGLLHSSLWQWRATA